MKYIVTGSANLRFADGTSFPLTPGIHDDFPAQVKEHWAFAHHAEELSDSAAAQQTAGEGSQSAKITALESELDSLKTQLAERDVQLTDLKKQLTTVAAPASEDKSEKTEKK